MDQLLVALDVESTGRALDLANRLTGVVGGFKIGIQLFTAEGPSIVRALVDRGARVFLDLKFHDIPNTVAGAVREATRLGVWMLNVHASGGQEMMAAAQAAALETAAAAGISKPLVIAVTALTSLDDQALRDVGVTRPVGEHVVFLAAAAQGAGLDGVVASPHELEALRARCGDRFVLVTPGIRGGSSGQSGTDDQKRTLSAADAIRKGASYVVVGRPIVAAPDPRAAAERIVMEMRS
jgi:orotidine-5'-phosphate decarboxylase